MGSGSGLCPTGWLLAGTQGGYLHTKDRGDGEETGGAYPNRSKTLRFLSDFFPTHSSPQPRDQVPERFGTWDHVEGSGKSPSFFKVTHPQFCPGKLPFNVCVILSAESMKTL